MSLSGVYGRKAYCAPEMFSQKCYNGELTDAWSMGVLLYEVLTGKLPFEKYSRSQIIKGDAKLEFAPEMSQQCQDLLSSILVIQPTDRLRVHQMMLHPWLRVMDEIPTRGRTNSVIDFPVSGKSAARQPRRSSAPASNISRTGKVFEVPSLFV
eukprot:CAMPEP_0206190820 /NCGR_PEP_ID=MMETSP0166-20121206/4970_1 /ASSEMBLY_ACC=CAM_ASM_000260 /TAXON_ID=95228 /ORGANISM="Vannella robusta, Strain DIVA3 518/3/11/1/6" /LENGTH=152 /DNA_ID=CAMNT_0053606957 /DNA_START=440 /DNA_END=898 /DNA_ORIENTATION=-